MSRAAVAVKLVVKAAIAALFLAVPVLHLGKIVYFAALGRLSEPDTVVYGRVAGGGDYLGIAILVLLFGAVGIAALRGVRNSWRELHEPDTQPLDHPPGANWGPFTVRVAEQAAARREPGTDEIQVPATRSTQRSDPFMAVAFTWIGHAVMILCAVVTLCMMFFAKEGAPVGIFIVFGMFFYLFAFLIRMLSR